MKRRKQNHKISFQFFAAPPCTPRRFLKGKEIFGFGSRPEGARGALGQLFFSKKVRAKVKISPPNVTSRFESVEVARAEGTGEGRKRCRFATKSLGTDAPKRADLSLVSSLKAI